MWVVVRGGKVTALTRPQHSLGVLPGEFWLWLLDHLCCRRSGCPGWESEALFAGGNDGLGSLALVELLSEAQLSLSSLKFFLPPDTQMVVCGGKPQHPRWTVWSLEPSRFSEKLWDKLPLWKLVKFYFSSFDFTHFFWFFLRDSLYCPFSVIFALLKGVLSKPTFVLSSIHLWMLLYFTT